MTDHIHRMRELANRCVGDRWAMIVVCVGYALAIWIAK